MATRIRSRIEERPFLDQVLLEEVHQKRRAPPAGRRQFSLERR